MPVLTREKGYCEQMLGQLADYTNLHGSSDMLGAVQAITSPLNESDKLQVYPLLGPGGEVKEYRLRYIKDLANATAFETAGTGINYACTSDNTGVDEFQEYTLEFSESVLVSEEWSTKANDVERFCRADYDGWRNMHLARRLKRARRKLNQAVYAGIKAGAGAVYVGENAHTSIDSGSDGYADSGDFTFTELLGKDGDIRTNWMLDMLELFELNGMSEGVLGVYGMGTLERFLRLYSQNAYCCNQAGLSLDRVSALINNVGFAPFKDSTIQFAPTSATRSETVFFEPGSTYLHQRPAHVGRGKSWELYYTNGLPKDVRTVFPDPVLPGVVWNYYLTHNPCGGDDAQKEKGGVWNEGFFIRTNVWTKPTTVNSNELNTTNQILKLNFGQPNRQDSTGTAENAPLG